VLHCFLRRKDPFRNKDLETTTAFCTYSNVPFPNLEEVPLIKQSDKVKILCLPAVKAGEEWKPKEWAHGDLVPLFWGESKTIELYEALIKNYNIQSVFDLSCHWALAAAALRSSIQYYGVAMCAAQAEWTMNITDRHAARCICQSDHPLYHQSLSSLLVEHFPDAVQDSKRSERNPETPP